MQLVKAKNGNDIYLVCNIDESPGELHLRHRDLKRIVIGPYSIEITAGGNTTKIEEKYTGSFDFDGTKFRNFSSDLSYAWDASEYQLFGNKGAPTNITKTSLAYNLNVSGPTNFILAVALQDSAHMQGEAKTTNGTLYKLAAPTVTDAIKNAIIQSSSVGEQNEIFIGINDSNQGQLTVDALNTVYAYQSYVSDPNETIIEGLKNIITVKTKLAKATAYGETPNYDNPTESSNTATKTLNVSEENLYHLQVQAQAPGYLDSDWQDYYVTMQKTVYVDSSNGDDSGNGLSGSQVRTLSKAFELIKRMRSGQGDSVPEQNLYKTNSTDDLNIANKGNRVDIKLANGTYETARLGFADGTDNNLFSGTSIVISPKEKNGTVTITKPSASTNIAVKGRIILEDITVTAPLEQKSLGNSHDGLLVLQGNTKVDNSSKMNNTCGITCTSSSQNYLVLRDNAEVTDWTSRGINWMATTYMQDKAVVSGNEYMKEGYKGGGLNVGTFIMRGGIIEKNEAFQYGAGVNVNESFTMTSGEIKLNTINTSDKICYGGGVYFSGSTFTMTGGTISNNSITGSVVCGGGLYISNLTGGSTVNISGKANIENNTITGVTGSTSGAGIHVATQNKTSGKSNIVNIYGDAQILNNKASSEKDARGGGISNYDVLNIYGNAVINGNRVIGASTLKGGGGIYNEGTCYIYGNAVIGNKSATGTVTAVGDPENATITGNHAYGKKNNDNTYSNAYGGGICNYDGTLYLGAKLGNGQVTKDGAPEIVGNYACIGGAVYFCGKESNGSYDETYFHYTCTVKHNGFKQANGAIFVDDRSGGLTLKDKQHNIEQEIRLRNGSYEAGIKLGYITFDVSEKLATKITLLAVTSGHEIVKKKASNNTVDLAECFNLKKVDTSGDINSTVDETLSSNWDGKIP